MTPMPNTPEWRDIPGATGYQVSNTGLVRSLDRVVYHPNGDLHIKGRVLKQTPSHGYPTVSIRPDGGKRRAKAVHRLVMRTFVGPRPEGMEVRHLNGISTDNRLENLTYGTQSENNLDRVRHGTHHYARQTHCKYQHALTPENTYIQTFPSGRVTRRCRTCGKRRSAIQNARRRSLVTA